MKILTSLLLLAPLLLQLATAEGAWVDHQTRVYSERCSKRHSDGSCVIGQWKKLFDPTKQRGFSMQELEFREKRGELKWVHGEGPDAWFSLFYDPHNDWQDEYEQDRLEEHMGDHTEAELAEWHAEIAAINVEVDFQEVEWKCFDCDDADEWADDVAERWKWSGRRWVCFGY